MAAEQVQRRETTFVGVRGDELHRKIEVPEMTLPEREKAERRFY